ncbi:E3 ubiquitin-protein ligase RHF2A isoform X1 [Neltuma alba]|uniref:E3 ubiquitin-protein ligase RHF2A isoform X1 n=1 Tax=Neltuma alba TaxID=207710 RepID=UPI0010A59178|nr:E3 ubiquitin-protein ligase RHF2A-like isoform X1 [Prosopis alba]XP_028789862.1 E3 ubiquitin-protein ligase RHF2A-like isoform X1 [Prosopis alba]XP_028789863.1 E3 ubiquitin-protein ligase RHF2A-like isoform X1 [Prosopis alba]
MEVPDMEDKNNESRMTSAAAFVEGGVQEACDDSCSICLEDFSESNPSAVTTCKHDFHLQCILEWCQRSSQCPMCWQSISFKDSTSQELFEAVVQERNLRATSSRNATIFHHLAGLGDFDLQHLSMGLSEADVEERIIQHLAAATVMGRGFNLGWREGNRTRSFPHGRPPFIVFSTPPPGAVSAAAGGTEPTAIPVGNPSTPLTFGVEPSQQIPTLQTHSSLPPGYTDMATNRQRILFNDRSSAVRSVPPDQGRAGPSELQSFSESLRSRLGSVSMRYKETISKGARGWKERLFSRSTSMSDIGAEVRRELNAGIASVSRLMERLETREKNDREGDSSLSNHVAAETSNSNNAEASEVNTLCDKAPAACSAGPRSD